MWHAGYRGKVIRDAFEITSYARGRLMEEAGGLHSHPNARVPEIQVALPLATYL